MVAMFIDGGHLYDVARADIRSAHRLFQNYDNDDDDDDDDDEDEDDEDDEGNKEERAAIMNAEVDAEEAVGTVTESTVGGGGGGGAAAAVRSNAESRTRQEHEQQQQQQQQQQRKRSHRHRGRGRGRGRGRMVVVVDDCVAPLRDEDAASGAVPALQAHVSLAYRHACAARELRPLFFPTG